MYVHLGASSAVWIAAGLVVLWAAHGVLASVPLASTALQLLGLVMLVQIVADAYRGKSWPALAWPDGKYKEN